MNFDLFDLKLFITISETENITHAAHQLHLVPAAISTRIKKLESSLGVKLIQRKSKGIFLTQAGHALVGNAKRILTDVSALTVNISQYANGEKGIIRLDSVSVAVCEYLPTYVGHYLTSHPNVNLEINDSFSDDIIRAIREGSTTVGIIGTNTVPADLEIYPFIEDSLVAVMHKSHELANEEKVSFEQVLNYDYIGINRNNSMYYLLHKYSNELGKSFKLRATVNGWTQVLAILSSGIGISVMELSATSRQRYSSNLSIIPLTDEWSKRHFKICVSKYSYLPQYAKEFIDLLVEK